MASQAFPIQRFGGLVLNAEADEVGADHAIDLLNVDLDKRGAVRTRDGTDYFTPASAAQRYSNIIAFERSSAATTLIGIRSGTATFDVMDTSGAVLSSQTFASITTLQGDMVRWGAGDPVTESEYIFFTGNSSRIGAWDGTTASDAVVASTLQRGLAVQPSDNRLIYVSGASGTPSLLYFSAAGAPTNFAGASYVELTPGDGEAIQALCSWRDLVFAFKESKFFVFYGNSTDATGGAVFNYRAVDAGVGVPSWAKGGCVPTPNGVYFIGRDGIYLTTGGPPQLISGPLVPLFNNKLSSFSALSAINKNATGTATIHWFENRLHVAVPTGASNTPDVLLVHSPEDDYWAAWGGLSVGRMTTLEVAGAPTLLFAFPAGLNRIGKFTAATSDYGGAAITSRYRSGFYSPTNVPSQECTVRESVIDGIGTPTFSVSRDFAAALPTTGGGAKATVTLGTSPSYGQGRHRLAQRGRRFSYQIEATSGAWRVDSITQHITAVRGAGLKTT